MRRFVVVMAIVFIALALASCSGGPTDPPEQVSISISPSSGTEVLQSGWESTPVIFQAIVKGSTETLSWSVDGSSTGTGNSFTANLDVGIHNVCASAGGVTTCSSVEIVKKQVVIESYLASGDKPELPISGAKVCHFILGGSLDYCSDLGANGKGELYGPFIFDQSFMMVIESPSTLPFLLTMEKSKKQDTVKAILIEKEWTISKGTYADTTVPISLELAYEKSSVWSPSYPIPLSFYPGTFNEQTGLVEYPFQTFKKNQLPVPVVLDRDSSDYVFTVADSIKIWGHIRNLETFLGETMFYPLEDTPELTRQNAIVITVDNSIPPGAQGGGISGGESPGDLTGGIMLYSGASLASGSLNFDNAGTVYHEFGHILGFYHTCSWRTVMYTSCHNWKPGSSPGWQASGIWTPHDVAYKEVIYTVEELRRLHTGSYGIPESHQGERVVTFGLEPQLYKVPF